MNEELRRQIKGQFTQADIFGKAARMRIISDILSRPVTSWKELTDDELLMVLASLRTAFAGYVPGRKKAL